MPFLRELSGVPDLDSPSRLESSKWTGVQVSVRGIMASKGGAGRVNQDLLDICFGVGLSVKETARVVGEATGVIWHEWSRRTGLPTPTDPGLSVIRKRAREVQRGWDEMQRVQARNGITERPSSATVDYRNQSRQAAYKRWEVARKAKQQEASGTCHSESIDEPVSASLSQGTPRQRTLSFECTSYAATG